MPSNNSYYIASIRKDYQLAALDEETVGNDPILFFEKWFDEARTALVSEVNAMTLATVSADNRPHARIVLLKGLDDKGFTFFTNYQSAKGGQIAENPFAAIVFFWHELERQVRIEGKIEKVTTEESDHYFHSRPEGSRLGAWSSPQSQVIPDRDTLEKAFEQYTLQFNGVIPRPDHWGGYRLVADRIEFWQGRSSRMHDRISFSLGSEGWHKQRLAP